MAAAIIPLAAAIAPSIIDLIAGLVHKFAPVAEATNPPKTGPVKFTQVFGDVMTALQNAANAGQIDKALPNDETIKAVIQAVVSSMKIGGLLGSSTSPATPATPAAGPQPLALKPGQTITITLQGVGA